MPTSSTLDALPQLDDTDVNLLYDIVCLAQQSRGRPIRALFDACEEILQQANTHAEHHSRCFRFLFHASNELAKDGTNSLVKRFKHLLASTGIQLVLGGEDNASIASFSDPGDNPNHASELPDQRPADRRERRRASFNDTNLDTTWISGDRLVPEDQLKRNRSRQSSHDIGQLYHGQRLSKANDALSPPGDAPHYSAHFPYHNHLETRAQQVDAQALSEDALAFRSRVLARRCMWLWEAKTVQLQRRQSDLLHLAQNYDRRVLLKQSLAQLSSAVFDSQFWNQQSRRAERARDLFLLTKAFTHWATSASDEVARTNVARRHVLRTRYFNAWRDITAVNELKCRKIGLRKWFGIWRSKLDLGFDEDARAIAFRHSKLVERTYWNWFWTFCDRKAPIWKDSRLKTATLERLKLVCAARSASTLAADGLRNRSLQSNVLRAIQYQASSRYNDEAIALQYRRRRLLSFAIGSILRKVKFDPRVLQLRRNLAKRLQSNALTIWRDVAFTQRIARQIDQRRTVNNAWTAWNDHLRSQTLQIRIDDRVLVQSLYKWVLEERLVLFRRVMDHRQKAAAIQKLSSRMVEQRFQLDEATQLFFQSSRNRLVRTALTRMYQISRLHERHEQVSIEFRNARDVPRVFEHWKRKTADILQLSNQASQARFYCLTAPSIQAWKEATINGQKRRRRDAYANIRRQTKMNLARRCLNLMLAKAAGYQNLQAEAVQIWTERRLTVYRHYFDLWRSRTLRWQMEDSRAGTKVNRDRLRDALAAMVIRKAEITEHEIQAASIVREIQDKAADKMFRRLSDNLFVLRRQADTAQAWQDRKFVQHRKDMIRYWASKANERRIVRAAGDPDSPSKSAMLRMSRNARRIDTSFDFGSTFHVADLPEYGTDVDATGLGDMTFGNTPLAGYLRTPSRRTARSRARFKSVPERALGVGLASATPGVMEFGSSVIGSTTPAPFAPGTIANMETLTPQVTPFLRKMRAGGYQESTTPLSVPQIARAATRFGASSRLRDTGRTVRFGDVLQEEGSEVGEELDNSPSRR